MARTKFTNRVSVKTATGQVALSPNQVANLRGQIARNMETHIALADEVIKDVTEWTPTQARVFSNLLNKVIPDLSASFHQHEHSLRALNEMSREELERIASGVDEIIDAEPVRKMNMTDKNKGIVTNPIAEAVPTKISTVGLGAAMSQLDLSSVPEHRHQEAVMDHFFRVMSENVMDWSWQRS